MAIAGAARLTEHGSGGAGDSDGGMATWLVGVSGADPAVVSVVVVVVVVVAGSGVLDTVESPELQPASAAAMATSAAGTASRLPTQKYGTGQLTGEPAATRAGTRLQAQ